MSYIIMLAMFESMAIANLDVGVVDPRMGAEAVSTSFLHCVLKWLGKSPRIVTDRDMFGPRYIGTSLRSAGVRRMFLVW